jgi:hypothetical protein
MGEIVELNPLDDAQLVVDLARYSEGVLTERQLRRKHKQYQEADWLRFGADDGLVSAVELESLRRVRSGEAKKEKSQQLIVKAPAILDSIACDPAASPRHRVDAIKTLDSFTGGQEAAQAEARFVIRIDLGSDVQVFDKPIEVGVEAAVPDDKVVVIPAKKTKRIAKKKADDDAEHL